MSKKKKNEAWGENGFEDWGGYMAAKKAKLQEQFQNEANKEFKEASNLFAGIAIFVNGYTDPTADGLRRLMMAHGGVYHHYMRPRMTTHIIASNLPYSKIIMYRKSQNPIPICKPQWITDSIKEGRVLNFQNYLLYSNCTDAQPQLKYKINEKKSESSSEVASSSKTSDGGHQPNETSGNMIAHHNNLESTKIDNAKPKTRSTKDSEFLAEFYSHSRLHHISTMGATFKDYVNELRDKSDGKLPGLSKLKDLKYLKGDGIMDDPDENFGDNMLDIEQDNKVEVLQPVIMHIDMDCFFVSVGLRNKPELKGFPVAVTHAKGNKQSVPASSEVAYTSAIVDEDEHGSYSEVASCSYEARKAGVKNGMFLGDALKLCPNLKTIPYDFEGYKEVSYTLYDTVASYTIDIEAVSCDEMYADCTKIVEESGLTPLDFASVIRKEIKEKTGCPVSTGFGSNKLLARLATRKAKPDGQFSIIKEEVDMHIGSLNVRDLPGVGGTTAHKLGNMNVRTCIELQKISLSILQKEFGKKTGEMLYNMCRGIDNTKLHLEHVRKSVSAEVNYGIRFETNADAVEFLKKLSAEVCSRLQKANAKGRSITLKGMVRAKQAPKETAKFMGHGLCDYMTRSKNLIAPIDDVAIVTKEVISLWNQLQQEPEEMRGIGIQISRLEISKNKSRNVTLSNFVGKAQQIKKIEERTGSNDYSENRFLRDSEVAEKSSKPKDLRTFFSSKKFEPVENKRPVHASYDVNMDVLAELPKDMQDEILGVKETIPPDSTDNLICTSNRAGSEAYKSSLNISAMKHVKIQNLETETLSFKNETTKDLNVDSKSLGSVQATKQPTNSYKQNLVQSEKRLEKTIQTRQDNFFKQTKSSAPRSGKVEMPPLQDIDMSVLIELPEDVRNEILNEYRTNRDQRSVNGNTDKQEAPTENPTPEATSAAHQDDHNISFSQVDPEFLAALSEDLQRDVQMYCAVKKTERASKLKKSAGDEIVRGIKGPAVQKQNKTERSAKPKNNGKSAKAVGGKTGRKKGVQEAVKTLDRNNAETESNGKHVSHDVELTSRASTSKVSASKLTANETEIFVANNYSILSHGDNTSQHHELLIGLVNRLASLPLEQVAYMYKLRHGLPWSTSFTEGLRGIVRSVIE